MIRSLLNIGRHNAQERTEPCSNNRRAGRVKCEGITSSWGDLINASSTGCRIRTRLDVKPGLVGALTINGPDGPIQLRARIVWARRRNWGKSEIGVQFEGVDDATRTRLARLAEFASRDTIMEGLTSQDYRVAG